MSQTVASAVVAPKAALSPQVQAALADLCLNLLPIWSRQLATSREQSEQAVVQLLAAFNAINPVLQQVVSADGVNSEALQPHIEQMFVGLQYQDRIAQMLALLQQDIARLHSLVEHSQPDLAELSVPAWLARLESLYAMAEQRRDHDQAGSGGKPAPSNEVSFF